MNKVVQADLAIIQENTHLWNWAPDWAVFSSIYEQFPESYSVLTPFAYSYLEELIRSTTSEYGREFNDANGSPMKRRVGKRLISLARDENIDNSAYIEVLDKVSSYFDGSTDCDEGDNRNSTVHGYMHSRFWSKEAFEQLLHDIALLAPHAGF